ncbi:flagellar biosynthetic protein FliO [bacterium]|nr:flagellar biosynthetic protein FliO [bacterium]
MPSLVGYQLSVFFTLAGICGILYVALRFTKNMRFKRFSGEMKIIDRLPVDAGASLVIVELKDSRLLLGISTKEIRLLKTLPHEPN